MRRSPLTRKSHLKRGKSTLKKSRLKPVSSTRGSWLKAYEQSKKANQTNGYCRCAATGFLARVEQCDCHHPFGRGTKDRMLSWVWLLKAEHEKVHLFPSQSFSLGWIQPTLRGLPHNDTHPRPWPKQAEGRWPESMKRIS